MKRSHRFNINETLSLALFANPESHNFINFAPPYDTYTMNIKFVFGTGAVSLIFEIIELEPSARWATTPWMGVILKHQLLCSGIKIYSKQMDGIVVVRRGIEPVMNHNLRMFCVSKLFPFDRPQLIEIW